jgi:hypothetical protein
MNVNSSWVIEWNVVHYERVSVGPSHLRIWPRGGKSTTASSNPVSEFNSEWNLIMVHRTVYLLCRMFCLHQVYSTVSRRIGTQCIHLMYQSTLVNYGVMGAGYHINCISIDIGGWRGCCISTLNCIILRQIVNSSCSCDYHEAASSSTSYNHCVSRVEWMIQSI